MFSSRLMVGGVPSKGGTGLMLLSCTGSPAIVLIVF